MIKERIYGHQEDDEGHAPHVSLVSQRALEEAWTASAAGWAVLQGVRGGPPSALSSPEACPPPCRHCKQTT